MDYWPCIFALLQQPILETLCLPWCLSVIYSCFFIDGVRRFQSAIAHMVLTDSTYLYEVREYIQSWSWWDVSSHPNQLQVRSLGTSHESTEAWKGDETPAADNVLAIRAGGEYPNLILHNPMHHRLRSIYAHYLTPLTLELCLCLH